MSERHPDLDALADLLVGEGTADDVEHVAHCVDCSATLADLDDALGSIDPVLTALLAAPVPELPADFDARLAARLAAVEPAPETAPETALPAAEGTGPTPVATGAPRGGAPADPAPAREEADVVPLRPGRPGHAGRSGHSGHSGRAGRPRGAGLLGVAAGGVGLLMAGALGLALAGGGLDGRDGSESAAGGATSQDATAEDAAAPGAPAAGRAAGPLVLASGTDYPADGAALAALLPALVGPDPGQGALEERSTGGTTAGAPGSAGAPATADAPGAPDAPVTAAEGDAAPAEQAPLTALAPGALGEDPLARLREPAALQACLEAVAGSAAGSTPEVAALALDYARTQGRPALVVVQAAGAGLVEVTAVGPSCGAAGPDRIWSHRLPG